MSAPFDRSLTGEVDGAIGQDAAVSPMAGDEERVVESALRPHSLHDFIGQPKVARQLALVLEGAKRRGRPPDHVLLSGPPGASSEVSDVVEPRRSRSSRISRSAPFLPMPGTCISALTSAIDTARRTSRGGWMASTAWASRGPTPLAVWRSSNSCRSSSSAKP